MTVESIGPEGNKVAYAINFVREPRPYLSALRLSAGVLVPAFGMKTVKPVPVMMGIPISLKMMKKLW